MITTQYKDLALEIVQDQTILDMIKDEVAREKISLKTYAKVFAILFFNGSKEDEAISWSKAGKEWRRGRKAISDVKLFGAISKTCDAIRYVVLDDWESCIISNLVPAKVLTTLENSMDDMEAMDKVQSILKIASEYMVYSNSNGIVDWNNADELQDPDSETDSE